MKKIGIYGGSFNPVHNGHVVAIQEFLRCLDLDILYVIPAGTPPHKELVAGSPDGRTRAHFIRLALDGIPGVVVDELELNREGKNYSYDTIITLRQRHPDDELFLLMGTDMLMSFDTWYRFRDILQMVTIASLNRYDNVTNQKMEEMAQQLRQLGGSVILVDSNHIDVSSTTARRMLLLGCGEDYVPNAVLDSIQEKQLYGYGADYRNLAFEELKEVALSLYDARRIPHAIGCSETAAKLAEHHGENIENARRSGILHDITKALQGREQLRLCEKYGIMTAEYAEDQLKLLHGKTAAAAAQHIFGENREVCEAISWHTTGKANMSLLEKIIYIADYMEPNRDFPGVEQLRKLAYDDIDEAVLLGVEMTISSLKENHRSLNRHSVETRDYLLQKRDCK